MTAAYKHTCDPRCFEERAHGAPPPAEPMVLVSLTDGTGACVPAKEEK